MENTKFWKKGISIFILMATFLTSGIGALSAYALESIVIYV